MTTIRFSEITSLYEELTPFYNPTKDEKFFLDVDFNLERTPLISQLQYGTNIRNLDTDNWIEDTNLNIFNNLPEQLQLDLIELIESFYLEDNNSHELIFTL